MSIRYNDFELKMISTRVDENAKITQVFGAPRYGGAIMEYIIKVILNESQEEYILDLKVSSKSDLKFELKQKIKELRDTKEENRFSLSNLEKLSSELMNAKK